MITGTTSSTGVAWGKVKILESSEDLFATRPLPEEFDREVELERFYVAVKKSREDLDKLRSEVMNKIGKKEEGIFEAQSLILEDPALIDEVENLIISEGLTAGEALSRTIVSIEQQFLSIEDKTIRQRLADVKDVGSRIMRWLERKESSTMEDLSEPVILVARDLMPSQVAQLDAEKVLAIVTEKGGINSHASIIARSLDIPAVVGAKGLLKKVFDINTLIVDGFSGKIYFNPDKKLIEKYKKIKSANETRKMLKTTEARSGKIQTVDGVDVSIFANIGRLSEMNKLREYGVEGVGVLRTEFLLMNRPSPPSVEEFSSNFKTILQFMTEQPVYIRLLDLGADKTFPYLGHPKETNPALGNRGIRFLLSNPHLLKDQIAGILQASDGGNPHVMIPMVTTVQEVREVLGVVRSIEMETKGEEKITKSPIPLGIMIETPAAALLATKLAKEVDFFSIGTNDLTQYTLATDRDNENVQDIYNSLNPAVLKLISECAKGAKKADIPISVCGEMAADIRAIPLLLGMGINNLSVGVNRIPEVKDIVMKVNVKKAKRLAKKAMRAVDVIEVEKMVSRFLRKMEKEFGGQ